MFKRFNDQKCRGSKASDVFSPPLSLPIRTGFMKISSVVYIHRAEQQLQSAMKGGGGRWHGGIYTLD